MYHAKCVTQNATRKMRHAKCDTQNATRKMREIICIFVENILNMNTDFNPFPVSGYLRSEYFCDREAVLDLLRRNIRNNINTTMFSVRRLGKSGLIHHLIDSFSRDRNVVCLCVDIFSSNSLKDFTNMLATAVYNRFPETHTFGKKIMKAITSLRPVISYDTLTGDPEVSFEYSGASQYEKTLQQIFSFLDMQGKKIVFAIDEFQQIIEYPEKNTEALLRTHMQTLKNTYFIFCGSNQKIMHEIFNNQKRPFYASCSNISLGFIDEAKYTAFIKKMFTQHKRTIKDDAIAFILDFTHRHTFYTQYLCNVLYASGYKHITLTEVYKIATEILKLNEGTYYQYRSMLSKPQWSLLRAFAKEERVLQPHSAAFLQTYMLGTSSSLSRGLNALMEKGLVYHNTSVAQPYYSIYDKFLMRWMQRL